MKIKFESPVLTSSQTLGIYWTAKLISSFAYRCNNLKCMGVKIKSSLPDLWIYSSHGSPWEIAICFQTRRFRKTLWFLFFSSLQPLFKQQILLALLSKHILSPSTYVYFYRIHFNPSQHHFFSIITSWLIIYFQFSFSSRSNLYRRGALYF